MPATENGIYDVAIIGAGPAGCAAALGLGQSGLKVVLIDKDDFPREKTCGDAIPGPAIKALSNAFPFFETEFEKINDRQSITSSRIVLNSGRSISYQWKLPAYNIKRSVFDKFFLDLVRKYTKVEIRTGYKVDKVIQGTTHIIKSDKQSIQAKFLIGSYGASELIQHPTSSIQHPVFAVRSYYKGINLDTNTNFFYVLKKHLPGYFWIFPLGGGEFNVGFGMKTRKDGKSSVNMKEALDEFTHSSRMKEVFAGSQQISTPSGALIPIGGKKNSYSGDGYILSGDAANLADPLQGHGIDKAIVSGLLSAYTAMQCFRENNFSSEYISSYDIAIKAGIERELRKNHKRMTLLSGFPFLLSWYSLFRK